MVERIKVSYRNSAYYVDRPNWDGGDVVMAADYDELEEKNERTKKWYLDAIEQRDKYARLWDESLSRTGAVKVGRKAILDAIQSFDLEGGNIPERFADHLLSALEPAAPEGQQPVAYRVHAPADEHYGIGPDRLQFHPLAQYDLDNGYRQTPLYTRPAEQAVTEALRDLLDHVDRNTCAHEDTYRGGSIWTICDSCGQKWADDRGGFSPYSDPEPVAKARNALKAAMEAGRHD